MDRQTKEQEGEDRGRGDRLEPAAVVWARQTAEDRSHLLGPHSSVSSACALSTLSARRG